MHENMDIEGLAAGFGLSPRPGVRPLPVHAGAVFLEYANNPALAPTFAADMTRMVEGIKKYQDHPYRRAVPPLECVWQEGQARLFYAPAEEKESTKVTVLLVPSMINRSTILDLMPQRSFTRWLARQGCDVYLLDWGEPVNDVAMADVDGVILRRLIPAMEFLHDHAGDFHAMGYCMGGTLLAAAASLCGNILKSAVFLAAPWDFHAGDRVLTDKVKAAAGSALQMIEARDTLPAAWIQSIFAIISADRTVDKFAGFAALEGDSEKARLFVAVEDWLNDGVDFPGALARTCIVEWYGENTPFKKEWRVGGECIDLASISAPCLNLASASDRLVPCESSLAMADLIKRCDVLEPDIGHIGMMTGASAERKVWNPVLKWILSV